MILVLWLARLLEWLTIVVGRATNAVYRVHFRHETRKAQREAERRAIEALIAETRPQRVGAPFHRDR